MSIIKKGSFIEKKPFALQDTYKESAPQNIAEKSIIDTQTVESTPVSSDIASEVRTVQQPVDTAQTQKALDALQLELDNQRQSAQGEISSLKEQADAEIQRLKESALAEVDDIKARAQEEGYRAGHQKGFDEYINKTLELTNQINELSKEKKRIFRETESEVLKMSLKIAEQLIRSEISLNQAVTMNIVTEAISKITDRDKVIVKVSKSDFDYVHNNKDRIHHLVDDIKTLVIQEDSTIESGGCIIETDLGYIDSRISMKLDAIKNAMLKVYDEAYEEEIQLEQTAKADTINEDQPIVEPEEKVTEPTENIIEEQQPVADDIDDSEVYDSFEQTEETSEESEDDDFFDFDDDWE